MKLPRLTVALRAFSNVSCPRSSNRESVDLETRRHIEIHRRARKNDYSWEEVCSLIKDNVPQGDWAHTDTLLKEIRTVTREIVGHEVSPDLVDAACVQMLITFHKTEMVSCQQLQELRLLFGQFQQTFAYRVCKLVNQLVSYLSDSLVSMLITKNEDFSLHEEFGKNFKYTPVLLPGQFDFYDPLLDFTLDSKLGDSVISLKYDDGVNQSNKGPATAKPEKKDLKWMEKEMKKFFSDNVHDMMLTTHQMLCSAKSNEELQNELFEFLGFDRFELIQILLEYRGALTSTRSVDVPLQLKSEIKSEQRPAFGCQIIVQSEAEKLVQKQVRREEKKIQKIFSGKKNGEDDEEQPFVIDPQYLKIKREAALRNAMTAPVFNTNKASSQPREVYPNVYDSNLEAKQLPGYICGMKMSLPIGFERQSNKQYEEVIIPPNDAPPASVGKRLKPIEELDEIGQQAFQGMKQLNRIQSVVFDTAYHTNENLLICAPTGAGKTNIAMLSIVHEIKQHIEGVVVKKDNFKIIYVAPMKALAAEMVRNFSGRLTSLGISVRELTGDMQLTKTEISQTQIIVTTPEKWDVVTRKGMGDVALTQLVRLLIIDEVHLLHSDRGAVLEALVARTLRQVESTQSMIRIIGLSATLPNYLDVARFLRVNPYVGLFFFDSRFRPVPLGQTFIGVKAVNPLQQLQDMDAVCYDKVLNMVQQGHQVMVFVHARNATVRTAMILREMASNRGQTQCFEVEQTAAFGFATKQVMRSRNKMLRELFPYGFSTHHAGMLRQDRTMVENLFRDGMIKVLVCTSTLAWGVNLPAHAVIIKGTEIYDSKHGAFVDLSFLDVLQIFGRAGRPQYDKSGQGTIITPHEKLAHYLSLLTCQYPIESQFEQGLTDNLNAEIVLGTVSNMDEAIEWLSYTYLFVRMRLNPLAYGIKYQTVKDDPLLMEHRRELILKTARALDKAYMARFDERTGNLHSTDLGRTASHFYIKYDTVELINEKLNQVMHDGDVLAMISQAEEFNQLKVREDEMDELENHVQDNCFLPVMGGKENTHGKVNILIQTHISRSMFDSFSLTSDQSYVIQNAVRIARAVFEIVLRRHWAIMAGRLLMFSKILEQQLWHFENPLRQFSMLGEDILTKLEEKNLSIDQLREMDEKEIGHFIRHVKMGKTVKRCVLALPSLIVDATIQPITREILRVKLDITPDFRWDDHIHGTGSESFWIWVEDPKSNYMHHYEFFLLTKRQVVRRELQNLVFTIPISDPLPNQYYVRVISDRWLGSESVSALSFQHLILPERHPPHTELLDLDPLPITALKNTQLEQLYNFTHFNPIQTQIFHTLYHTDKNVLLGAPTGSGKTIAAEIAMWRVFREYPGTKVVYIAPLKALVRERIEDWKVRLTQRLGRTVVELTGDVTPDVRAIGIADVIVTTPEKWDGVSRSWQTRNYVKSVSLIVIDEIHLLGEDRGPVLEVIVSRTNFISSHTDFPLRVIGLSTALANARDLADWLGIKEAGLFNFRPSVRPVPLEVHIEGFPGKHYCPRMATMNKPTYQAITMHSPIKPTLVFVSSRRQTRLTALDLIAYCAAEDNPKQWLHMAEDEMDSVIVGIRDTNLKLTLAFGIGIHHAGLHERDRKTVEELFLNQKIQVLIATATLAWGVNLPAHLVVVKGTEYYDGKTRRYADFPITDVLQMMGRAGRPQFDDQGVAVILVHDVKKNFYRKFLYSPFPVESSLLAVLADHLNAEIVAGTVTSKQDSLDYLTWTFFFRRLIENPSYYQLEDTDHSSINKYLSALIEKSIYALVQASCIEVGEDRRTLLSTTFGRIASYYYLHHDTLRIFKEHMTADQTVEQLLKVMCSVHEYEELPVRHNEDAMNTDFAKICPLPVDPFTYDSPHTKANLLFQAHFSRLQVPCSDYLTDLKSVLDQAIRILQAMLDVAADQGWLATALRVASMIQMVLQGRWYKDNSLLMLPHIETHQLHCFRKGTVKTKGLAKASGAIECLPQLIETCSGSFEALAGILRRELDESQIEQVYQVLNTLPLMEVRLAVKGWWEDATKEEERRVRVAELSGVRPDSEWIKVHADQEYVLNISITRLNQNKRTESTKAYAPRFGKPKDEGWFLILGDIEHKELLALKRVGYISKRSSFQLSFYTPEEVGRVIYTIYILSDSYIGLDQQYDICLDVLSASIEAQVNTELKLDDSLIFPDSPESVKSGRT